MSLLMWNDRNDVYDACVCDVVDISLKRKAAFMQCEHDLVEERVSHAVSAALLTVYRARWRVRGRFGAQGCLRDRVGC